MKRQASIGCRDSLRASCPSARRHQDVRSPNHHKEGGAEDEREDTDTRAERLGRGPAESMSGGLPRTDVSAGGSVRETSKRRCTGRHGGRHRRDDWT